MILNKWPCWIACISDPRSCNSHKLWHFFFCFFHFLLLLIWHLRSRMLKLKFCHFLLFHFCAGPSFLLTSNIKLFCATLFCHFIAHFLWTKSNLIIMFYGLSWNPTLHRGGLVENLNLFSEESRTELLLTTTKLRSCQGQSIIGQ